MMTQVPRYHGWSLFGLLSLLVLLMTGRIPLSAWYVLPFGLMFSAIVIRLLGKIALKYKRSVRNTLLTE
jgi:hypothetical protein